MLSLLGLIFFLGGWLIAHAEQGREPARESPFYLAMSGVFAAVWSLGWIWMAYNSLVGLRERVRLAWSLIEVQLKRRADLIPNLVRLLEGLQMHEQQTQRALAALRSQASATAPGERGPEIDGCAGELRVLVEAYPALQAEESFRRLQAALTDTEQRIALARSYFNDIASYYNTRLESIPDRFLALLGNFPPRPLLSAAHFERATIDVQLAE